MNKTETYKKALTWLHNNIVDDGGGVVVFNTKRVLYPEVTGYFIPSLINAGENNLAISFAKKLCKIQKDDGSWYDPDGKYPFIFDTGQILKGLIAVREVLPEVNSHIIHGIEWIFSNMNEEGRLVQPNTDIWGKDDYHCNDLIHIYALSPIIEAAEIYNKLEYKIKVNKILDYYINNYYSRIVNYSLFSHFYAYVIEGLIDCGRIDIAKEAMEHFEKYRQPNGAVYAYKDVKWVCSTALFQFAIIWYKLNQKEKADLTYKYACSLQNESGGWYGSYGKSDFAYELSRVTGKLRITKKMYARNVEISWAVKFYLDATFYKEKSEQKIL